MIDVYVRLIDAPVAYTVEHSDELGGVIMDYAEDGRVVGVEILGAVEAEVDGQDASELLRRKADPRPAG